MRPTAPSSSVLRTFAVDGRAFSARVTSAGRKNPIAEEHGPDLRAAIRSVLERSGLAACFSPGALRDVEEAALEGRAETFHSTTSPLRVMHTARWSDAERAERSALVRDTDPRVVRALDEGRELFVVGVEGLVGYVVTPRPHVADVGAWLAHVEGWVDFAERFPSLRFNGVSVYSGRLYHAFVRRERLVIDESCRSPFLPAILESLDADAHERLGLPPRAPAGEGREIEGLRFDVEAHDPSEGDH